MLRVIVQGKFSQKLNCAEDVSMGRGIFSLKWSQVTKNEFFPESQGATLKLKTNRNYYVYERDCPLSAPRSLH